VILLSVAHDLNPPKYNNLINNDFAVYLSTYNKPLLY
jgi:hypothetical protein